MRIFLTILEFITLIMWFGCTIMVAGGGNLKPAIGGLLMLSGVWVIVAALMAYQNQKTRNNG